VAEPAWTGIVGGTETHDVDELVALITQAFLAHAGVVERGWLSYRSRCTCGWRSRRWRRHVNAQFDLEHHADMLGAWKDHDPDRKEDHDEHDSERRPPGN
jgi:hypothetical protein